MIVEKMLCDRAIKDCGNQKRWDNKEKRYIYDKEIWERVRKNLDKKNK